jgi:hypothetical protein
MVSVHNRSQENARIDMFAVGDGWSTPDPAPFFLSGSIACPNFHLVSLELGGKKVEEEKKSGSKSEQKGPATQTICFDFDSIYDRYFSEQMCEE